MLKRRWIFAAVPLILAATTSAHGATSSGAITLQATVVNLCSAAGSTIAFGTITPSAGQAAPNNGSIAVTCTLSTPFTVGLSDGLYASGGARRMRRAGSSDYLTYNLYKDASVGTRFGDTGATDRAAGVGQGVSSTPIPVFATVPPNQAAPSGAYSDTVQITVYY